MSEGQINAENIEEVDATETAAAVNEEQQSMDSEKIIEKLQKRLDSKTRSENVMKTQLDEALQRISELETGSKKSVKDQAEVDKEDAKDQRINELERELELKSVAEDVDSVLKESGMALTKEELALVVDTDSEKAYEKVKTLLGLINRDRSQQAIVRNTGTTPTRTNGSGNGWTKEKILEIENDEKRQKLMLEHKELFTN